MLLAGSILVHAVVTACTSVSNSSEPSAKAQQADASGSGPDTSSDAGSVVVSAANCNATAVVPMQGPFSDGGTETIHFSEQAYPGKSKEEIAAHVTHWLAIEGGFGDSYPAAYKGGLALESGLHVRDGFAAAGCSPGQSDYFIWRP